MLLNETIDFELSKYLIIIVERYVATDRQKFLVKYMRQKRSKELYTINVQNWL